MAGEPIDTGTRRGDVHYEPDADQGVKVRFTHRPAGPLPPGEVSDAVERGEPQRPPVEEVAVAPAGRSVWDARPEDDTAAGPSTR